jgi:hypothetical protein
MPTTVTPAPRFTPGFNRNFNRLAFTDEGVLFEDNQLQIGLKSEYHGHLGRITLYFGNKISVGFSSFTLSIKSQEPDALSVTLPKLPTNTLAAGSLVEQVVQLECHEFFSKPPVLRINYLAGSMQEISLRLPVILTKFVEPVQLAAADFFERWKQIGGPPREAQQIFAFKLTSTGEVDTKRHRKVVTGARVGCLDNVDPNPVNLVGAGVLHMSNAGKVGCLLRSEPNREAKVSASTGHQCVGPSLTRLALSCAGSQCEPRTTSWRQSCCDCSQPFSLPRRATSNAMPAYCRTRAAMHHVTIREKHAIGVVQSDGEEEEAKQHGASPDSEWRLDAGHGAPLEGVGFEEIQDLRRHVLLCGRAVGVGVCAALCSWHRGALRGCAASEGTASKGRSRLRAEGAGTAEGRSRGRRCRSSEC